MIRSFAVRLAWREGRAGYRRLSVFMGSISLGVGALVAIHSFRADVERSLSDQARALLGSDVRVSSNRAFPEEFEAVLDSMAAAGREIARTTTLASMVLDTRSQGVRLVQVRAVDPGFPFYGDVASEPEEAWEQIQSGPWAVADPAVLVQLDARIGDTLAIGQSQFVLKGTVSGLPTDVGFQTAIGPRVYIARDRLEETGLLVFGSMSRHQANFYMPRQEDRDQLWNDHRGLFREHRLRHTPAAYRAQELSSAVDDLARYLGIIGLAALFLAGIGVASAIYVYVREKVVAVAVLRCLGARQEGLFAAYLLQAAILALAGSLVGVALGIGVQSALPRALAGVLPLEVETEISWLAALAGVVVGVWVALMFVLGPLLEVRGVPPLRALRHDVEPSGGADPWKAGALALLGATVVGLTVVEAPTPLQGLAFSAGLGGVALVLWGAARTLISATRRFSPRGMSYPVRQGVSNIFRPQNQTVSVTLALGFGAFVLGTLSLVENSLVREFTLDTGEERSNLLLFDVQTDQLPAVASLVAARAGRPAKVTPLVPSRLLEINGRSRDALLELPAGERPERWALRREYRHTYRQALAGSELLASGHWWGTPGAEGDLPRVSLEADLAESLRVSVGDRITWDFAGVPLETRVASLRTVDWTRFETNFFVVFEPGSIEDAPQTAVIMTRVDGERERAEFQRDIVRSHANVSVLDLSRLQEAIDTILGRANRVVRFLGAFSTMAGVLVLIGALATSRYQRMRECALLRTLGAGRAVVVRILAVEYVALGSLATIAGLGLAVAAAWLIVALVFEVPFALSPARIGVVWLLITALTLGVGLLGSRGVLRRSPLAVLRDVAG